MSAKLEDGDFRGAIHLTLTDFSGDTYNLLVSQTLPSHNHAPTADTTEGIHINTGHIIRDGTLEEEWWFMANCILRRLLAKVACYLVVGDTTFLMSPHQLGYIYGVEGGAERSYLRHISQMLWGSTTCWRLYKVYAPVYPFVFSGSLFMQHLQTCSGVRKTSHQLRVYSRVTWPHWPAYFSGNSLVKLLY